MIPVAGSSARRDIPEKAKKKKKFFKGPHPLCECYRPGGKGVKEAVT